MSWLQKLYETYNNCQSMLGVVLDREVPLLPICHTTYMANIEITIDGSGNFRRARVLSKAEARTIIPCSESSGGRTSNKSPHPLCDKLQYVAKDYSERGGGKSSYFDSYIAQLEQWCASEFSHPKAKAVLSYAQKGTVIGDQIENKIFGAEADGRLLRKWETEYSRKPYDLKIPQIEAFIRWQVEIPGQLESSTWLDETLWDSWIGYYSSTKTKRSLCYITGKEELIAEQHPAKLRYDGDKAKLISSGKSGSSANKSKVDDPQGFTFLGRYTEANQAATFGMEATQKVHHALRWLISRQGYSKDNLAIVAWGTFAKPLPQPTDDAVSMYYSNLPSEVDNHVDTNQTVAIEFRKAIAGYSGNLSELDQTSVIALDSATEGRLAIICYREFLDRSDYLQRIDNWQESCSWLHTYRERKDKGILPFIGAPAPNDIAEAAYGINVDDKLRKATIARLLFCIIDSKPIPRDLMESAVRRASNRLASKNQDRKENRREEYSWEKTLSIACSLFKKFKEGKETYDMALDETRNSRDYLYGRLLAVADKLEAEALRKAKEKRATNAARYMQQFSQRPYQTWNQIHSSLASYVVRLGGASFYMKLIGQITCQFNPDDFVKNDPLTGEYLLGYYCQREKLYAKQVQDDIITSNDDTSDDSKN